MVTLGQAHGAFPKLSKHSGVQRDMAFHIRVTLQFYQATSNGIVTEAILQTLACQLHSVQTAATWAGSLVTSLPTQRDHIGVFCDSCKQNIAGVPLAFSDVAHVVGLGVDAHYKCLVCPAYDRCETCVLGHPTSHPFVRLTHAQYGPSNYITHNRSRWTHPNTNCSCCFGSPIVGILYRCTMCPSVVLCERCHAKLDHPLIKQVRPASSFSWNISN
ncbi:hypothetical protein H310_13746 [Aphanomyces invadans]|uniref:ZZ-type domain-containing protein n=1 Tax=Aphanomyces invadans TaxID=157072 RepID=A0A024TCD3_9STRA|nr:hypothetical protein H310_13746 [Aphanomyces invadans]ETV91669.1 hypothetical protein H310_13746 [Aphanomyces invadans]|eukprot:XP_008879595.1 hypothetical protein H310_13746 [Aphanomyces invadans]